jgi:voltage-dependent anion channel protein 2
LKYDAVLSFSKPDFISSLTLTSKGDTLKASYLHIVSPLKKTVVVVEISHKFSRSENTFTIRTQHALYPLTTVKGCLNNYGKEAALLQHEWRPKSFVTLFGEVDTKALYNSAKVGLSLILKP